MEAQFSSFFIQLKIFKKRERNLQVNCSNNLPVTKSLPLSLLKEDTLNPLLSSSLNITRQQSFFKITVKIKPRIILNLPFGHFQKRPQKSNSSYNEQRPSVGYILHVHRRMVGKIAYFPTIRISTTVWMVKSW